jgi:hypothetical protein
MPSIHATRVRLRTITLVSNSPNEGNEYSCRDEKVDGECVYLLQHNAHDGNLDSP